VPGIYDPQLPDETVFVSTEEAYEAVQRLTSEEGLLVGPSSGAALAASLHVAKTLSVTRTPAVIVMIFPDSGHRYLSEGLFGSSRTRPLSS
jgi:cysteine synthase